jgi:hypothetical protein
MSQSSDIPRPPRTDAARQLLASRRPTAEAVHAADPETAVPEQRVAPEIAPRTAGTARPAPEGARRIRASDAEREDTVQLLHQALGEGRLDLHETETRVTAAYAAVFRDELPAVLDDLPQHDQKARALPIGNGAPDWQTLWTAVVWRARVGLWNEVGAASRTRPPGPRERRIALLLVVLAGLWVMIWATIGAVL